MVSAELPQDGAGVLADREPPRGRCRSGGGSGRALFLAQRLEPQRERSIDADQLHLALAAAPEEPGVMRVIGVAISSAGADRADRAIARLPQ